MSASSSKKVILAALIGNSMIAVTKFIAAHLTGSSAMLSEGIHSLVDTGNQVLLLHGLKRAARPADKYFPYGHGKEIYFWSFVVAILIFALGAGISLYQGYHHILHPVEISNPIINYVVLSLAIVFEGGSFYVAAKAFNASKGDLGYIEAVKKGKDPSIFVVLFEDAAAMLGLFIALMGIIAAQVTGIAMFDGIASMIIGVILALTAFWMAVETKGLLIGESADQNVVDGIHTTIAAIDEVNCVNEVLTLHMGASYILANISVDFKSGIDSDQIEDTIARLDAQIKVQYPDIKKVFIEAESRSNFAAQQQLTQN
jgi:cation diffusion facilitator family transporter